MNKGKIGSNKNIQGSLSLCLSLPTEKEEKAKIIKKKERQRERTGPVEDGWTVSAVSRAHYELRSTHVVCTPYASCPSCTPYIHRTCVLQSIPWSPARLAPESAWRLT